MACALNSSVAVTICNGYKSYKAGSSNETVVLHDFNMTVTTGSLYSLLGSSGSGKTTVLSCLVGLNSLDRGQLRVFGCTSVPISPTRWQRIGYMPQEISLQREFSILETLFYFGKLFGSVLNGNSSTKYLQSRISFLTDLLHLPDVHRLVGTLSGGQKRRVSFAVAVLNEPKLLLLDEPTSGVDPLDRECIWKYLSFLVTTKGTTVIFTTHYVDETKNSDVVGVMRDGKMLIEANPETLLKNYQLTSLETVFLELCKSQDSRCFVQATKANSFNLYEKLPSPGPMSSRRQNSGRRVKALMWKNYTSMFRNLWLLAFTWAIPAFIMVITGIPFQRNFQNIPMGVVNLEVKPGRNCFEDLSVSDSSSCMASELSCSFVQQISQNTLQLESQNSLKEAETSVRNGHTRGYIHFPGDFTAALKTRILSGSDLNLDGQKLWNNSNIVVHLDQTNTLIYTAIYRTLYEAFEEWSMDMAQRCGLPKRNGQFPLQYSPPIYGANFKGIINQVAPGMAMNVLFFCSLTVSVRFISEKRQGAMDRCLAGGTQLWEISVAFVFSELATLFIQCVSVYCIVTYYFAMGPFPTENPVNAGLVFSLYFLLGLCGILCALLMGLVCNSEELSAMIITALFFPNMFIAGVFWPLEGTPQLMQLVAPFALLTLPTEALRSIMIRGWEFSHARVWPGFVVPLFYLGGVVLLIIWTVKRQGGK